MIQVRILVVAAVSAIVCVSGDAADIERAQQLWEQLIMAKGGRERLRNVRTMVQSERTRVMTGDEHWVRAYVFPDRVWQWADMSSTVLGMELSVYNLSTGRGYSVRPNTGPPTETTGPKSMQAGRHFLHEAQLIYLNETAWLHPDVKGLLVVHEAAEVQDSDAIETLVNGERVDFYLDRTTHLPVQITVHHHLDFPVKDARAGIRIHLLSDYRNVGGIQVPHCEILATPMRIMGTIRFDTQLNVPIRDDLFTSPPSLEDGPDGWKPKSSAPSTEKPGSSH